MGKGPKISIIMPVYNSEKYMDKSISSILNQTLEDIELICINDCSSDDSLGKLKAFQKRDKRIKIASNKKNVGPGEARNVGMKKAKGEYVCFVDSDDWLELNACDILYKKAKKENADIVFIKPKLVFTNKVILDKRLLTVKDLESKTIVFRKTLRRKVAWAPWSKMVKRELILKNKIKFPSIHVAEDMDFSYRVIFSANKIVCVDEYLYNYYLRENSLMAYTSAKRRIENYFESIKLLSNFLKENGISKKYKKDFFYFKLYSYLAISGVMLYSKEKIDRKKYRKMIKDDSDFKLLKIISLGILGQVVVGSILIKLHLFNPVFKMREFLRIVFGSWGKRAQN